MSEQLLDVAVEWFTYQFEEKFETDYSIALCRPECQLAQQSSLTPISIKVHWCLTLPNTSRQLLDMVKKLGDCPMKKFGDICLEFTLVHTFLSLQ